MPSRPAGKNGALWYSGFFLICFTLAFGFSVAFPKRASAQTNRPLHVESERASGTPRSSVIPRQGGLRGTPLGVSAFASSAASGGVWPDALVSGYPESPRYSSNIVASRPKFQTDGTFVSPRVLAIPVAALWLVSVYEIGALKEIHHEYYGAALLLARPRWMQWVGLAIMADDSYQHARQWSGDKSYQSPLHRAYGLTLYRWFR